jgi:phosphomannomutase
MSFPIKFGTDGWRGRIADNYTYSAVRRCAHGFAQYLIAKEGKQKPVVIGYDKRFASEDFARIAAEVVAGNGLKVFLTQDATPTPVISHAVVEHLAAGGINITASHNPAKDNGFKVRNRHGGALAPASLKAVEELIPDSDSDIPLTEFDDGVAAGTIEFFDPGPAYLNKLETLVDLQAIRDAGLHVLVDPMWGNGAGWFPKILEGGSTKVSEIHNVRNPSFPDMTRPEPIPPNVDAGLEKTKELNADVLIITDGDADRLGVGDERGDFVNQLRVYGLLVLYLLEVQKKRDPIVKTLSTTSMINKLGDLYGVDVHETGVGFKYVAPKMLEVDALIGGEESGGYAFQGHVPERDGLLAGLYILDMMVKLEKKPSELIEMLFEKVGAHYYDRIDTSIPQDERELLKSRILDASPESLAGLQVTGINTTDGYKFELEDGQWLLVRFSGTEPIVRVYCETLNPAKVDPLLQDGLMLLGFK